MSFDLWRSTLIHLPVISMIHKHIGKTSLAFVGAQSDVSTQLFLISCSLICKSSGKSWRFRSCNVLMAEKWDDDQRESGQKLRFFPLFALSSVLLLITFNDLMSAEIIDPPTKYWNKKECLCFSSDLASFSSFLCFHPAEKLCPTRLVQPWAGPTRAQQLPSPRPIKRAMKSLSVRQRRCNLRAADVVWVQCFHLVSAWFWSSSVRPASESH